MNRFEAKAFIEETHELLNLAAASTPDSPLTPEQESDVLALEDRAVAILTGSHADLSDLYVITNDGLGPSGDEKHPSYNTFKPVISIEVQDKEKVIDHPVLGLMRIPYKTYVAHAEDYTDPASGNTGSLTCTSGPEGFIPASSGPGLLQFGAASALLARILEVRASGADRG